MARTYANGELEPTIIRTPLYMIYAGMVFGLFVFLLQALCDLVKVARACKTLAPGDASRALIFRSPWFCLALFFVGVAAGFYLFTPGWLAAGLFLLLLFLLIEGVPVFTSAGMAAALGINFPFGVGGLPQVEQIPYK